MTYLKPGQRDIVVDMRGRGYSVSEIARRFQVAEQTARNIVKRSKKEQPRTNPGQ